MACFVRQNIPGQSNFSKTPRGIGISGVNRVPKNLGPEKCVDQFGNRSVSPPPNSDTFRSACLLFFISVFTLSNVSYLEVSRQNHRILHVSWQNWTAKQCSELINVAAKKQTKTNWNYLPPTLFGALLSAIGEWIGYNVGNILVNALCWWFWTKSLSFVSKIYC